MLGLGLGLGVRVRARVGARVREGLRPLVAREGLGRVGEGRGAGGREGDGAAQAAALALDEVRRVVGRLGGVVGVWE